MTKLRGYQRALSMLLTVLMVFALIPVIDSPVHAAVSNKAVKLTSSHKGSTLSGGYFYYITSNTTITGDADKNGLIIWGTETNPTYIYIPSGVTLTVTGGAASAINSAGRAAIRLDSGRHLVVLGGGTLNVTGGAGYTATRGSNGGTAYFNKSANGGAGSMTAGWGGAGGMGASGGGAGIGTDGSIGGYGGYGGSATTVRTDPNNACLSTGGKGGNGGMGYAAGNMGLLRQLGVTINAYGGGGGSWAYGGSAGGNANDSGSGFSNDYTGGGGGGGGGGGAALSGHGVGSGGSGGSGGGGGGGGGTHWDSGHRYAGGYGGGGGYYGGGSGGTSGGTVTERRGLGGGTSGRAANNTYVNRNYSAPDVWPTFNADFSVGTYGVAKTYSTLTYNLVGGITITLPAAPTAKPGYEFTGWKASYTNGGQLTSYGSGIYVPNTTDKFQPNDRISPNRIYGDITFTAQWRAATYTVSLIAGRMLANSTQADTSTSVVYKTKFADDIEPPTSTTHTFQGYYSEPDGGGTKYFDANGNPTTAIWANPVTNPRLYAHWEEIENKAELKNGSFEAPVITNWNKMYKQGTAGLEWYTTASDGVIELANPGLDRSAAGNAYYTKYAAEGEQFAELNANKVGSLYQTIDTSLTTLPKGEDGKGRVLQWGLSHKGRSGTDTLQVWIGNPTQVQEAINAYIKDGNKVGKNTKSVFKKYPTIQQVALTKDGVEYKLIDLKSDNAKWHKYTGEYEVPESQAQTMFAFISIAASGNNVSYGNLLDNIYFQKEAPKPTVPVTVHPPVGGSVNVAIDGALVGTAEGTTPVTIHALVGSKLTINGYPNDAEYTTIGANVTVAGESSFVKAGTLGSVGVTHTLQEEKPVEVNALFAKKGYVILDPNGGSYNGSTKEVKMSLNGSSDTTTLTPKSASRAGYAFTGWKVADVATGTLKDVTVIKYLLVGTTPYMVAYNGATEVCRVKTAESGLVLIAQYEIVDDIPKLTVNVDLDKTGATLDGLPDKDIYATEWNNEGEATEWEDPMPDGWDDITVILDAANTSYALGIPVAEGFIFDHWDYAYGDESGTVASSTINYSVDSNYDAKWGFGSATEDIPKDAITIKAVWRNAPCALTLDLNDDGEGTPKATLDEILTSYTPGTEQKLPTPRRTGYAFAGWYPSKTAPEEGYEEKYDKVGIAGQTGNITLYARWNVCDHSSATPTCVANDMCDCGAIVLATGHDFGEYVETDNDVKTTCTVIGTVTATCENKDCTETDTKAAESHAAHNYQEVEVKPTCVTAGYTYDKCTVCGNETNRQDGAVAIGHNYEGADLVPVEHASCETAGLNYYECIRDGCVVRLYDPTPAEGHKLPDEFTIDTPATCTADGHKSKTCTAEGCDYVVYEAIPALGHKFQDEDYEVNQNENPCTTDTTETALCANGCDAPHTRINTAATGHDLPDIGAVEDWIIAEEDEAEDGRGLLTSGHYKVLECGKCDYSEIAGYAAHAHGEDADFVADLTNELNCSECGYLIRPAMFAVTISANSETTENSAVTLTYDGKTIDISEFFTHNCAKTHEGDCDYDPVYALASNTAENAGAGTRSGTTLTVTKAGTFILTLRSDQTKTHIAGEVATVILTVEKAAQKTPMPETMNNVSVYGGSNGAINNLDKDTEYIVIYDGAATEMKLTTNSSGELTGLVAGSYIVKLEGNDLYKDSEKSAPVSIKEPAQPYKITFYPNDGIWKKGYTAPDSFTSGDDAAKTKLPTADEISKEGNRFDGWYKSSSFTDDQPYKVITDFEKTLSLYAKWTLIDYNITVVQTDHGEITVTGGVKTEAQEEPATEASHTANYEDIITTTYTTDIGYQLKANTMTYKVGSGTATAYPMLDEVYTLSMPAGNIEITAVFEETPERVKAREAIEFALNRAWTTDINVKDDVHTWIAETLNTAFASKYEEGKAPFGITTLDIELSDVKLAAYGLPGKEGSFKFVLTIDDPVLGKFEYTVNPYDAEKNTNGGRITTKDIIYAGNQVNITVPVINATPNAKGDVVLVDPLDDYAGCTEITWSDPKTNGTFNAETEYVASVELTAKDDATFDSQFVPVVPGGVVSNVVVSEDGDKVTFDVTFPPTGDRVVEKLEVDTHPDRPYDKYMTGDGLELDGLVIEVTYQDGTSELMTLADMVGETLVINDEVASSTKLLEAKTDNDEKITVIYGGESVELGPLTVSTPPTLILSAPYNMDVIAGDKTVTGGEVDYKVIKGSNSFDWELVMEETTLASGENATVTVGDTQDLNVEMESDTLYTITLKATDKKTNREYSITKTFRSPSASVVTGDDVHDVSIGVIDEYGTGKVIVSLVRGNEIIQTLVIEAQEGGTTYDFMFEDVPEGTYNLVVDNGKWVETHGLTIDENFEADKQIMINLLDGKRQSVLDVTPGAPTAIVDGLPELFENKAIYTPADAQVIENGGTVEIKMMVHDEDYVPSRDRDAFKAFKPSKVFGLVMDLSLYKNRYDSDSVLIYSARIIDLNDDLLTIEVDLLPLMKSAANVVLLRMHDGYVEEIPEAKYDADGVLTGIGENGEYFVLNKDRTRATIVASRYCSFAFMQDPSGGASGRVIIEQTTGGTATTNVTWPSFNQKVTITLRPEEGYTADGITVVTESGRTIKVTDNGDGTYSFLMPAGDVRVQPRFTKGFDVSWLFDSDNHAAYMFGDTNGMFKPEAHMTRAEMAQMFYNLLIDKDVEITATFPDVEEGAWYEEAVNVMASLGIIKGHDNGNFGPEDPITRAQFATVVVRFTQVTGETDTADRFTDVPSYHWAYNYIGLAYEFGLVNGTDSAMTTFEPDKNITRAEAATMTNRVLERNPDEKAIDTWDNLKTFPDLFEGKWYYYQVMETINGHEHEGKGADEIWLH